MRMQYIQLSFFSAITLLCINIAITPGPYYDNLIRGDIVQLVKHSYENVPARNVLAVVLIIAVPFLYFHLVSTDSKAALKIDHFLSSTGFLALLCTLLLLASARLVMHTGIQVIDAIPARTGNIIGSINLREDSRPILPSGAIDVIFADRLKVEDALSQIRPSLAETERITKQSDQRNQTAAVDVRIAAVMESDSQLTEQTSKLKAVQKSRGGNTVDLIRLLAKNESLIRLSSLSIQSEELQGYDSAISLLRDAYGFSLPENLISTTRSQIISREADRITPDVLSDQGWILASGNVDVKIDGDRIGFVFDYVPSAPSRVRLSCEIPKAAVTDTEVRMLSRQTSWDIRLFGRLVRKQHREGSLLLELACYSIFR